MKPFVKNINRMLLILGVVIILVSFVSMIWLNEAQRLVVLIGAGLGILNLLGLAFFVYKNANRRK